jgi:hypothetical protein
MGVCNTIQSDLFEAFPTFSAQKSSWRTTRASGGKALGVRERSLKLRQIVIDSASTCENSWRPAPEQLSHSTANLR